MRTKRNKYGAKKITIDGITFHSIKEGRYYQKLLLAKRAGELLDFETQVVFILPAKIKYILDFKEHWKDGTVKYVDVKGFATPVFKLKKKLVEEIYKIKIDVV